MSRQAKQVAGQVVAITGGARGIGRSTAAALVAAGGRVAIGDLDLELAQQTAAELGGGTVALHADVTDADSFEQFLDETEAQLGPLDVLINNAGIMPIGPFVSESPAISRRILEINTWGVIVGCRLALTRMQTRGRGHIVNVASQAGRIGFSGGATYCASKHAVVGFSRSLAEELDGTGIEVSCVMPGIVHTELSAGLAEPRLLKSVEPGNVAAAIVEALAHPRVNVHVPRTYAAAGLLAELPIPAKLRLERWLGAEAALLHADGGSREAYEQRLRDQARD